MERFDLFVIYRPHKEDDLKNAGDRVYKFPEAMRLHTRIRRIGVSPLDSNQVVRLESYAKFVPGQLPPSPNNLAAAHRIAAKWEGKFEPLPIDFKATIVTNSTNLLAQFLLQLRIK